MNLEVQFLENWPPQIRRKKEKLTTRKINHQKIPVKYAEKRFVRQIALTARALSMQVFDRAFGAQVVTYLKSALPPITWRTV